MIQLLKKSVSQRLDIRIEYVDSIPKTQRGKHKCLIQKVSE